MVEDIVVQNPELLDWIEAELTKASFEGEADALAKYIIALLETYALDDSQFATNDTVRGKCVEDLSDFLGEETQLFVESLFRELGTNPLKTSADVSGDVAEEVAASPSDTNAALAQQQEVDQALEDSDQVDSRYVDEEEKRKRRSERFGSEWQDEDLEAQNQGKGSRRDNQTRQGANRELRTRDNRENKDGKESRGRENRETRENRGREVRENRDVRENRGNRRNNDRRRSRNDEEDRNGHSARGDREQSTRSQDKDGKAENTPPGQAPFPPMPIGAFPPAALMEMMMAAAGNNPNNTVPPPPFLMPFRTGPFLPQGAQGVDAKDLGPDGNRRGGFSGRGRGRGGIQRGPNAEPNRPSSVNSKTTLLVRNLPAEKLNFHEISDYFSKFGTVVNIQLRPAANPDRAFIEFSKPEEAQNAINSVEAVMGNRHVKLHWSRDGEFGQQGNSDQADQIPGGQGGATTYPGFYRPSPRDRERGGRGGRGGRRGRGRGDPYNSGGASRADFMEDGVGEGEQTEGMSEQVDGDGQGDGPKESAEEVNARKRKELLAAVSSQKKQKMETNREATEEKKRVLAEQRKKLEVLEAEGKTMSAEDKKKYLEEINARLQSLNAQRPAPKPQEANSGTNLDALQAKLSALKKEAKDLGIDSTFSHSTPRGRGFRGRGAPYPYRGGFRGRGRGRGFHQPGSFAPGNMSLDLRPREILIHGVEDDSAATRTRIRGSFQNVDSIEKSEGAFTVKFQTRAAAELAMSQGSTQLGPGTSMSWPGEQDDHKEEQDGISNAVDDDGANELPFGKAAGGGNEEEIEVDYEEE